MLTLGEATRYNREAIKTNRFSSGTIRKWYAEGYYLKSDGKWYITVGGKEYQKYYTGE